jgi:hypothetical protein
VLDNIPTDSFSDVFTNMFEQLRRHHPETIWNHARRILMFSRWQPTPQLKTSQL